MEDNIYLNANDLLRTLDKLLNEVKDMQEVFGVQGLVTDLNGTVKELYEHRDALHFFMKMADEGYVYWMEAGTYAKAKSLQLISCAYGCKSGCCSSISLRPKTVLS